jgi:hypothetical protein
MELAENIVVEVQYIRDRVLSRGASKRGGCLRVVGQYGKVCLSFCQLSRHGIMRRSHV